MIQELIVVEGKNDAHKIRQALGEVDVIWTEGYGLTKEKLDYIKNMAQTRGVIVFTDPDSVGEQIRERIRRIVPEAKHVYISKKHAIAKNDVGVENAAITEILNAFKHVQVEQTVGLEPNYNMLDLIEAGLTGRPESTETRKEVGRILGIGDANAKQFLHRLNRFKIEREAFYQAIKEVSNGECR